VKSLMSQMRRLCRSCAKWISFSSFDFVPTAPQTPKLRPSPLGEVILHSWGVGSANSSSSGGGGSTSPQLPRLAPKGNLREQPGLGRRQPQFLVTDPPAPKPTLHSKLTDDRLALISWQATAGEKAIAGDAGGASGSAKPDSPELICIQHPRHELAKPDSPELISPAGQEDDVEELVIIEEVEEEEPPHRVGATSDPPGSPWGKPCNPCGA